MKTKLLFYSLTLVSFSFIGCMGRSTKKDNHFSEEQVKSLQLEDTKIIKEVLDSIETIDINPFLKEHTFDFGSMISEVKTLPLETTDKSLISQIENMLITESYVYVVDNYKGASILIFNNQGKFIKRIMTGHGPGEVLRVYDIDFDKEKQELVVYDKYHLSFFTADGTFVRKQRVSFRASELCVIPGGYLFKALNGQGNKHFGYSEEYLFFVMDKDFKLESVGLPYSFSPRMKYSNALGYLHTNGDIINVAKRYSDTIYQYKPEEKKLVAKYALDLSSKELPRKYLMGTWDEFNNALSQNDYFLFNGQFLETTTHNVFSVKNWNKRLEVTMFKDKRNGNMKGGTRMQGAIDQIPPIGFPVSSYGDYFVSYYRPHKQLDLSNNINMSDEDKQRVKGLTEDDNPVLVLFRLKEF